MEVNTLSQSAFNIIQKGDFYIYCPHCDQILYIDKIKCGLFLHAFDITTGKVLNPHSKLFYIDNLRRNGKLGGCGGRFKLLSKDIGIIIQKI